MIPYVVDAPLSVQPNPAWSQVFLRARGPEKVAERVSEWSASVRVRRLTLPFTESLTPLLDSLPQGLRVSVSLDRAGAEQLDAALPARLWDREVNLWAEPAPGSVDDALDIVTRASLAGWPVRLPLHSWALQGHEGLLDLLDHYLFRAELEVPVEPFHSLLMIKVQRQRRTLWNLWFGHPEDYFYVDDDRHVALCASWSADQATRYGRAQDDQAAWRQSAGYRRLLSLLEACPAPDEVCAACDHNRICGGVLRALGATSCTVWQEIFTRLRLVAGRLQRSSRSPLKRPDA